MTDKTTIEGEGRWLIVRNESIEPISVPHPSRDAKDSEHLNLGGFEEELLSDEWLDSPTLMRDVERGRLSLRRSDTVPSNEFAVGRIVDSLMSKGWQAHAAITVWQICASQPIPPEYDYLIELEPTTDSKAARGPTSITPRWDLIQEHLPWLKEILSLERRWRKRSRFIGRLNARIEQLERMSRGV
jgi:hypothetical protein